VAPQALAQDIAEQVTHSAIQRAPELLESPWPNISDGTYLEAYELAADRIWDREGVEREPTPDEIDTALESIQDRPNRPWEVA
jgi:hypothetical protein